MYELIEAHLNNMFTTDQTLSKRKPPPRDFLSSDEYVAVEKEPVWHFADEPEKTLGDRHKKNAQALHGVISSHRNKFLFWFFLTGTISAGVSTVAVGLWSHIGWGAWMYIRVIEQEDWTFTVQCTGTFLV